jgi:hypothetical protein
MPVRRMPRGLNLDFVRGEKHYWIQLSPADSNRNTCNVYIYTDTISMLGLATISPTPIIESKLVSALREQLSVNDFAKVMQVIRYHLE